MRDAPFLMPPALGDVQPLTPRLKRSARFLRFLLADGVEPARVKTLAVDLRGIMADGEVEALLRLLVLRGA